VNTAAQRLLRKVNARNEMQGKEQLPDVAGFDPELLYVECEKCGRPVVWEPGRTSALLLLAGVELETLDSRCLLVSEGCSACTPGEFYFTTKVTRLDDTFFFELHHRGLVRGRA